MGLGKKMALEIAKTAEKWAKTTENDKKTTENGEKTAENGSKTAENGEKTAEKASKKLRAVIFEHNIPSKKAAEFAGFSRISAENGVEIWEKTVV
jgi:hypothetical protein